MHSLRSERKRNYTKRLSTRLCFSPPPPHHPFFVVVIYFIINCTHTHAQNIHIYYSICLIQRRPTHMHVRRHGFCPSLAAAIFINFRFFVNFLKANGGYARADAECCRFWFSKGVDDEKQKPKNNVAKDNNNAPRSRVLHLIIYYCCTSAQNWNGHN